MEEIRPWRGQAGVLKPEYWALAFLKRRRSNPSHAINDAIDYITAPCRSNEGTNIERIRSALPCTPDRAAFAMAAGDAGAPEFSGDVGGRRFRARFFDAAGFHAADVSVQQRGFRSVRL